MERFLPENWNKTRMSAISTSIMHCTGYSNQCNKVRNRINQYKNKKVKNKTIHR